MSKSLLAVNESKDTTTVPVMHGDHIASCLCCKHFTTESGTYFSEETGWDSGYISCDRDVFNIMYDPDPEELHETLPLAQSCGEFDPKQP